MTGFSNKGKWLISGADFAASHHDLNCFRLTGNSSGGDCRRAAHAAQVKPPDGGARRLREKGSVTAVKDGC
ncbi:MAG: hypothetical protein ACT6Q8_16220 [Niveispirillum sp.]|uniref:hypothetical protein n=1 Tax=Niveispirillum sp. TaxID=1917217 RepID=UPI0040371ADA